MSLAGFACFAGFVSSLPHRGKVFFSHPKTPSLAYGASEQNLRSPQLPQKTTFRDIGSAKQNPHNPQSPQVPAHNMETGQ